MLNTLKNFQNIAQLGTNDKPLNELAKDYQQTSDPVIFAQIFCKLYPYMRVLGEKYFYLTEQDKASFITEELSAAVLVYSDDGGAQLQTLVRVYICNRLRTETQAVNKIKRRANNATENFDDIFSADVVGQESDEMNSIIVETMLMDSSLGLTKNELAYCKIVMQERYLDRNAVIARSMGITGAGVSYIRERLRVKLRMAFI